MSGTEKDPRTRAEIQEDLAKSRLKLEMATKSDEPEKAPSARTWMVSAVALVVMGVFFSILAGACGALGVKVFLVVQGWLR